MFHPAIDVVDAEHRPTWLGKVTRGADGGVGIRGEDKRLARC
jgi:hypothetical protein